MTPSDDQRSVTRRDSVFSVSPGKGLLRFAERLPTWMISSLSVLLALLVSYLDFATSSEYSLLLFYLFPISLAAWFGSRRLGVLVAALSGFGWLTVELIDVIQLHPLTFVWNSFMRISVFLVLAYLLSALRLRLVEVSIQAQTDPLTGLYNRRYLYERIEGELQRMRRRVSPLTLVSIDVDDFKSINDQHGHAAGDAVLKAISEVLRKITREIDVAARTGGDEFVVLLIETDATAARDVATKIQDALRRQMQAIGRTSTFSFGAATFEQPPATVDEMFRLVDAQLYSAKHLGKNRLVWTVAAPTST